MKKQYRRDGSCIWRKCNDGTWDYIGIIDANGHLAWPTAGVDPKWPNEKEIEHIRKLVSIGAL